MINAKTVLQSVEALTTDAELLKDIGHVGTFLGLVGVQGAHSPADLLPALLLAAGATVSTGARVLARLAPQQPNNPENGPTNYQRFRILFYVLTQQCYFQALTESSRLKNLSQTKPTSSPANARQSKTLVKAFVEKAAQVDEAEISFHYGIDPTHRRIPLYDAYSGWLAVAIEPYGIAADARQSILSEIDKDARKRLRVALAADKEPNRWMASYLAITTRDEFTDVALGELISIRKTLDGWKDPVSSDADKLADRWAEYRETVVDLPALKETMYNEDFGVDRVFIMPDIEYHRAGLAGSGDSAELAPDLGRLVGALVSSRLDSSDLIILSGGPGSGKSTLCRMIASELAADANMHPIFLRLRRCKEGSEIGAFIEDTLVKEGVINRLSDLRRLPNVVLILDGFDELVLASKVRLRHFFSTLLDDLHSGALRHAKVIVSGRDTLFPKGEGLPRGSHVLSVMPFDKDRITLWGNKWRSIHGTGPGSTFRPEVLVGSAGAKKRAALHQLVAWPLTLHLLARVHTAGLFDISAQPIADIEKAYLYRGIMRETARRQEEKTGGTGRLPAAELREFLRVIAWTMYTRSVDSLEVDDVLPLARNFFSSSDEVALAEVAEVAIVSAPEIQKGEDTGFEFVHKSFAEFLVAERIAQVIDDVTHQVTDVEQRLTWHRDVRAASVACIELFGVRIPSPEVQEMLEPMLGAFSMFKKGEKVEDTVERTPRKDGLARVRARFGEIYSDFAAGGPITPAYDFSRDSAEARNALEILANYGASVVLIGAAACRRLAKLGNPATFCLETFDGAFWRWLMIVHAGGVHVDKELARRLYKGASVIGTVGSVDIGDFSLPVRINTLTQLHGYRSSLRDALDDKARRSDAVAHASLALYLVLKNLLEPSLRDEVDFPRDAQLFHFARHAVDFLRSAENDLYSSLERAGLASAARRDDALQLESLLEIQSSVSKGSVESRQGALEELERVFCYPRDARAPSIATLVSKAVRDGGRRGPRVIRTKATRTKRNKTQKRGNAPTNLLRDE